MLKRTSGGVFAPVGSSLVKRITWEDWWVDPEVVPYFDYREQLEINAP